MECVSGGGCRYSVFVGASLLLTFVTLSAALLRMLRWVRVLADCTDAESQCLRDVQRWFYTHVVRGLVSVDAEVLEAQAAGLCDALASAPPALAPNATSPVQESLAASFQASDVRRSLLEVIASIPCLSMHRKRRAHRHLGNDTSAENR